MTENTSKLHLITIPISHYCEKARWALDRAKVPYIEKQYLPVFHLLPVKRAGGGDSVPVLVTPQKVLPDSTDILQWIDTQVPDSLHLYPSDPVLRREVEEWEEFFDLGLGVAGRLWMYSYVLNDPSLVILFSKKHQISRVQKWLLPTLFPVVKKLIQKTIGLRDGSREYAFAKIEAAFARVATTLSDGREYLVGNVFTAADLTFAALSAAILLPENYGVELPRLEDMPEAMRGQIADWRKHRAGVFAARLYEKRK